MEIFLNRIFATLAAGIDAVTTSLPLTTGHGARFGTIAAGSKVRIVFLDATLNVSEVAYITAITGDTATIARGQDGSTAVIHLAADRVEARIGKSTLDSLTQKAAAGTDAIAETLAAASKATPIDADIVPLRDSVTGLLRQLTWANIKATLKTYFDTVYWKRPALQTLTDGAAIAWDFALGDAATVTIAGNRTVSAPTTLAAGSYILIVKQDAVGSRLLTWNAAFKWPAGAAPVLSTAANGVDVFSFFCDGTNLYGSYVRGMA